MIESNPSTFALSSAIVSILFIKKFSCFDFPSLRTLKYEHFKEYENTLDSFVKHDEKYTGQLESKVKCTYFPANDMTIDIFFTH